MNTILCPCHSKKLYSDCCEPYHKGSTPSNALLLMRARYATYANALALYIIITTHPQNPSYKKNKKAWEQDILTFSRSTQFKDLTILEWIDGEKSAYVTFHATLFQNNHDVSFTEKSYFEKQGALWLYHSGHIV